MNARTITHAQLAALVADLVAAGTAVTAPARAADGRLDYRPVTRLEDAVLGGGLPRLSLKALFLPPTEPLFSFRLSGPDVAIDSVPTSFPPHVVLGAVPCDAAGVQALDKVMGWDYRDELWFGRREATTIVSVACSSRDESCFCGATGGGPTATRGADLLLVPLEGGFAVEVVTPKGEALVAAHEARFGPAPNEADVARSRAALDRQPRRAGRPARARHRLARRSLRGPALGRRRPPLPRLRRLRLRLPHLPLLRHRRRARGGHARNAPPQLGHLPGGALHAPRLRPQPAGRPARPLPPARDAQVLHLPRPLRGAPLHRLRPLQPRVPGRHGPPGGPPDDRGTSRRTGRRCRVNLYEPYLVESHRPRRRDARHPDAPPRLPGARARPDVRLQGGPVRRVHRLRRRRVHVLHRLLPDPSGLHRVQLQDGRKGDDGAARR